MIVIDIWFGNIKIGMWFTCLMISMKIGSQFGLKEFWFG